MAVMTPGTFVRNTLLVWMLAAVAVLVSWILMLWLLEDDRPMTIRIESALGQDAEFQVEGSFQPIAPGQCVPTVNLEGVGPRRTITVPAGQTVDVPVRLDVPSGLWGLLTGEIRTGDLAGQIVVQPVSPVPGSRKQVLDLSVHVESAWETWWILVVILVGTVVIVYLLKLLCDQVLASPRGVLSVVQATDRVQAYDTHDSPMEYQLADQRLHWRKAFWMRDLFCVNTPLFRNLSIQLQSGDKVTPFVMEFTEIGVTARCPSGEFDIIERDHKTPAWRVADPRRRAEWLKALQHSTGNEQDEPSTSDDWSNGSDDKTDAASSSSLFFGTESKDEIEDSESDLQCVDCCFLESGMAIVAGNYLLVYQE